MGGDEFVIILENSTDEDCRKLIYDINEACINEKYDNIAISIALGWSIFTKEDDIKIIMKQAERRLYNDKMINQSSVRKLTLKKLKNQMIDKNIESRKHLERLIHIGEIFGKSIGLEEEVMKRLLLTIEFHDIGKIAISAKILSRKNNLSKDDLEVIKCHAEIGYRLANTLPEIINISREILTHHERWDGKGFPLGLKEREIPLISRL